jgi:hypothetical protein
MLSRATKPAYTKEEKLMNVVDETIERLDKPVKRIAEPDDKLLKELVGLAGEHLAAGELLRRGVYAQITYGDRKKVDLLIDGSRALARVEVKTKQGRE